MPEGFTLLELLVAIVLLALLTVILLAGFRFETEASYRQSARLDRESRVPVVFTFLRSHLSNARPVLPINSNGTTIVFDGRASDVAFIDAAPQGAQTGGLYFFTISFSQRQLRVRWHAFEGMLPVATDGDDTLLLDNIAGARFAYYGTLDPSTGSIWHEQWRGVSALPRAIRLEIAFADGERTPPLIVRPRLRPLELPALPVVQR